MSTTQRPNRIRTKCIARLPVEIWVAIMHHAIQSSRIRLSWTDRDLRYATINDPLLWTEFHFPALREQAVPQPCLCPACSPSQAMPAMTNDQRLQNTVARLMVFLERSRSQPFQVRFDLQRCPLAVTTVQFLLRSTDLLSRVSRLHVKCFSLYLYPYLEAVRTNTPFPFLKTLEFDCPGGAQEPDSLPRIIESGMLSDCVTEVRLPAGTQWRRSWGPFRAIEKLHVTLLDFHQLEVVLIIMPNVRELSVRMSHKAMDAGSTDALAPVLRQCLLRLTKLALDSSGPVLSWTTIQLLSRAIRDESQLIPEVALYGLEFEDDCVRVLGDVSGGITLQFTVIRNISALIGISSSKEWLSIIASSPNSISRELRFWMSDISKDATWFFRRVLQHLHSAQIENLSINWNLLRRFVNAAGAGLLSNVHTLALAVPPEQPGAAPERLCSMPKLQHVTFCCDHPGRAAPLPAASVRSLIESVCGDRSLDVLDLRGVRTENWSETERRGLKNVALAVYGMSSA